MKRKQVIVLEVEFDSTNVTDPAYWAWSKLTDEQVIVIAAGPAYESYENGEQ